MQLSPRYDGPPILEIEALTDPSAAVARQRRRLVATLASLTDEQWATPSRCEGWSVTDVVCHLITVDQFWAISFAAGLRGEPTRFLATFDPVASPAQSVERMRTLSASEVLAQFTANVEGFLDVLGSITGDQWALPAEAPPGHVAMSVTALHALWDAWVHERDIAIPLGVGDRVVVRPGASADGPRLAGRAVDLIEGLSHRAPLVHDLAPDDQWLLLGLAEVFDLA